MSPPSASSSTRRRRRRGQGRSIGPTLRVPPALLTLPAPAAPRSTTRHHVRARVNVEREVTREARHRRVRSFLVNRLNQSVAQERARRLAGTRLFRPPVPTSLPHPLPRLLREGGSGGRPRGVVGRGRGRGIGALLRGRTRRNVEAALRPPPVVIPPPIPNQVLYYANHGGALPPNIDQAVDGMIWHERVDIRNAGRGRHIWQRFDMMRASLMPHRVAIINALAGLPMGFSLRSSDLVPLEGISLRELYILALEAGVSRDELYVTAEAYDFKFIDWDRPYHNRGWHPPRSEHRGYYQTQAVTIMQRCLGDVFPQSIYDNFTISLNSVQRLDTLQAYMMYIRSQAVMNGESDMDGFLLFRNISIQRRRVYSNNPVIRTHNTFKTAGFDLLIPVDIEVSLFEIRRFQQQEQQQDEEEQEQELDFGFLFVPGGEENCVVKCLKRGYCELLISSYALDEDSPSTADLSYLERKKRSYDTVYEVASMEVDLAYQKFHDNWMNERKKKGTAQILAQGMERFIAHHETVFKKAMKHGFSPYYFKLFQKLVVEELGIYLHLVSEVPTTDNTRGLKLSGPSFYKTDAEIQELYKTHPSLYELYILQTNLDGKICSRYFSSDAANATEDKVSASQLAHAVLMFPAPCYLSWDEEKMVWQEGPRPHISFGGGTLLNRCSSNRFSRNVDALFFENTSFLRDPLLTVISANVRECDGSVMDEVTPKRIQQLIHQQNVRSGFIAAPTPSAPPVSTAAAVVDDASAPPTTTPVDITSETPPSFYDNVNFGILVYDLETVENLRGIQDELVYEPLRKGIPIDPSNDVHSDFDCNNYYPPECQIPYTVQWGVLRPFWRIQDPLDLSEDEAAAAATPLVNDEVHIERGSGWLGKCVDDFLQNVGNFMVRNFYQKLFAYAHNGSGFDALLIKACNTKFPMRKILVTPRGILSLSIQVAPGRELIFRDTKVFFQARLSDLCTVFKVPAKYCKTDFPITRIHARNFTDPFIVAASEEYMKNDIFALAFIVKGINEILEKIGEGALVYNRNVPVITQFVTLMSAIKAHQRIMFRKVLNLPPPPVIEYPSLRKWVNYANVGGRTMAFWKGFASSCASSILKDDNWKNLEMMKNFYWLMKDNKDYFQVLDVTSLYPYVMYDYPMPCVGSDENPLYWITPDIIDKSLDLMCTLTCRCEALGMLCEEHRIGGVRDLVKMDFPIIFVVGAPIPPYELIDLYGLDYINMNICPRKLANGDGLNYSFFSAEELSKHYKSAFGESNVHFPECTTYTIYDFYWMKRVGWKFPKVLGALVFPCSYAFREDTLDLFKSRIEAKRIEKAQNLPKSFSTFCKLFVNGRYGINAQQDILTSMIITDEQCEENLRRDRKIQPDEEIVRNATSHQCVNNQWILKLEKRKGSCEFYANQSPNQIGAAVCATARHHMNLTMFRACQEGLCSYTDTDSLALHAKFLDTIDPSLINQSAEAPMGTYKNDHEEGKDEIIFLSFIIAKKVKLHCTLDAHGIIRLYPTFKGYNPPNVNPEDGRHRPDFVIEKEKVEAIAHAFYHGDLEEVVQTEFRRDLVNGITIDKHAKFSASMNTFMGHSYGSIVQEWKGPPGLSTNSFCERLVPLGYTSSLVQDSIFWQPYYENWESFPHSADGLRTVINPSGRTSFWDKCIPERQFLEFTTNFYKQQETLAMATVEMLESEHDFLGFDSLFLDAPQLSESDFVWAPHH